MEKWLKSVNYCVEDGNIPYIILKLDFCDNILDASEKAKLLDKIQSVLEENININCCENCGEYFVPQSRSDEKYCDRPSPKNPDRTCKQYGAKKKYRENVRNNLIQYEKNKTQQFFTMRAKRSKTEAEREAYLKRLQTFKDTYKSLKYMYDTNSLSEKSFLNWIRGAKHQVLEIEVNV